MPALINDAWHAATLQNGWVNWATTPAYVPSRYRKLPTGQVELQVMITSGTVTQNTVILTLPVGYRPSGYLIVPCLSNNAIARCDLSDTGNLLIVVGASTVWLWVHLVFFADQ